MSEIRVQRRTVGLEDKHGTEIREGDILRINSDDNQLEEVNATPTISTQQGHGDCTFAAGVTYFGGWGNGDDIEIIGSIYENPDLMRVKRLEIALMNIVGSPKDDTPRWHTTPDGYSVPFESARDLLRELKG